MNIQQGISNVELIYFPSVFLVRYCIFFFVTLAHFRPLSYCLRVKRYYVQSAPANNSCCRYADRHTYDYAVENECFYRID